MEAKQTALIAVVVIVNFTLIYNLHTVSAFVARHVMPLFGCH